MLAMVVSWSIADDAICSDTEIRYFVYAAGTVTISNLLISDRELGHWRKKRAVDLAPNAEYCSR
jgi:hypothetical protein